MFEDVGTGTAPFSIQTSPSGGEESHAEQALDEHGERADAEVAAERGACGEDDHTDVRQQDEG